MIIVDGIFVFGLVPAVRSTRPDVRESVKECVRGSGGAKVGRMREALVAAEVMLAQALLIVAGLTIHSFVLLTNENAGLDASNLLTTRISLPSSKYADLNDRHAFFYQLVERVREQPGVVSAAAGGHR